MRSALLDVVIVVTVAPQSPPSPIPCIRPMRTPDTPVNMLVVAAIVNAPLSLFYPLPVTAGGTQPLRSSRVAVVCGVVGCDPPSSTSSSLSPSRRNLRYCPFLVSTRRGPRTRSTTSLSSTPLLTSPSPPSARRRSRGRYGMSCSSHLTSSL